MLRGRLLAACGGVIVAIGALGLSTAGAQPARDISAETVGYLADLLAPYASGTFVPPSGVEPAALRGALDALRQEKLLGLQRPPTAETDLVERYGRALALGTRASQFLAEIAAVRDAARRR